MGSPEFAMPALVALASNYQVVGVVTQPDRPSGRGREITPPPIKILANDLGLPFIQPEKLHQPESKHQLQEWNPDLIIVAAFGQILRREVLDLPKFGCLNVHASLLPRWRGAAPIVAAIREGDTQTGVTIMRMDNGVDTGPVLSQRTEPIHADDTGGSLSQRLAQLGADLLIDTIPISLTGEITPLPQDETQATYAPMLKKADGWLDFALPAAKLARQVRAYNPWPGAFFDWRKQIIRVHRASAVEIEQRTAQPSGYHLVYQGEPAIQTSQDILVLEEIQSAGKNPMPGKVFLQGARAWLE